MTANSSSRVSDFIHSIGVNTHLSWWDTAWGIGNGQWAGAEAKVQSELAYLGVSLVRDSVPSGSAITAEYAALAQAGIRFDMLQTVANGQVELSADIAAIAAFQATYPGAVFAYEGANEYNANSYSLDGQNSSGNLAWGILDAQSNQVAVASNPQLAGLTLIAPSTASVASAPNVGAYVTASNWHVYGGIGQQLQDNIAAGVAAAQATAPGHPVMITETGISSAATSTSSYGVTGSEPLQGLIDVNAMLDAYRDGAKETFLYELMDNNVAADQEDNFGLFNADGTPKAAAIYIHNLLGVLADDGANASSFTPGTLNYSVNNLPVTASTMLLEKSSGAYDIMVWNGNATLFNQATDSAVTPATTNVTVQLGGTYQTVEVFDPIVGTAPMQTLHNVSSLTLSLAADPLIVEVEPNQTTSTTTSPSGTEITAVSAAPIIDAAGNAWSLVQSTSKGLQIAVNGVIDAPTQQVVLLETVNGAMVQENSSGNWYSETTPNDSWTQITDPNPTSSPSGTSITSASASPIIDQNGNAWSLVQSASNGLQIAVNGTVDAPTANVVLLETLNGAMIQENSAGNWYSETTPNDSWVQIANPNPAPVVSTITTSPGSGDLTVGATVTLTVTFSSAVTVASGTPTLALNDGGVATYVSGSGSSALVFKYTVAAGQNIADLTSAASSAITLNGATIRGTSGTNAVLTGANGYNPAGILQIDTTAPTLSVIAESPGSGQVATGGTVTLTATLSEAVTVAGGTPTLALNDGGTATYLSGSGSSALAFKYTVAAGQSTTDLKLAASNAVALNGGTIRDAAGNNAVLTGANGYTPAGTLAINPPASPPATNDFLIMPGSGTFKDAAGNTYSLDSSQNAIENGMDIPGGGGTSAMAYFNGTILGQDAGGTGWYTWNQTNWQPDAPNVSDVTSAGTLTESLSQTGTFAENGDTFVLSSGNVLKATLGSGNDNVGFIGPQQVVLTGGSGAATVLAAGGNNKFTAGSGSLDVTAGAGKDAYVFHATSGLLTLEDFSLAKGDTLTIDKALQGSLHRASDGTGGTMVTFGANTSHGVDIRGLAALPSSNILWA